MCGYAAFPGNSNKVRYTPPTTTPLSRACSAARQRRSAALTRRARKSSVGKGGAAVVERVYVEARRRILDLDRAQRARHSGAAVRSCAVGEERRRRRWRWSFQAVLCSVCACARAARRAQLDDASSCANRVAQPNVVGHTALVPLHTRRSSDQRRRRLTPGRRALVTDFRFCACLS